DRRSYGGGGAVERVMDIGSDDEFSFPRARSPLGSQHDRERRPDDDVEREDEERGGDRGAVGVHRTTERGQCGAAWKPWSDCSPEAGNEASGIQARGRISKQ